MSTLRKKWVRLSRTVGVKYAVNWMRKLRWVFSGRSRRNCIRCKEVSGREEKDVLVFNEGHQEAEGLMGRSKCTRALRLCDGKGWRELLEPALAMLVESLKPAAWSSVLWMGTTADERLPGSLPTA